MDAVAVVSPALPDGPVITGELSSPQIIFNAFISSLVNAYPQSFSPFTYYITVMSVFH